MLLDSTNSYFRRCLDSRWFQSNGIDLVEVMRLDGLSTCKLPRLFAAQITAFTAIVGGGSITSAANELGLGRSGLSDNPRHFEHTLGCGF